MAQPLDLDLLAERLRAAAARISSSPTGLCCEKTGTDLVIAAHGPDGGHGQGRTESIAFGVLFHDPEDRLGQSIDRIEAYCKANPQSATVKA